ncbi:MAG TPA: serine--tRNA ligase, partial [Acetobacteraceae bacterium]|nr:serine--tRNA ligase [Acetobacteraceae bacterium]
MHDIRTVRANPAAFDAAMARRGLAPLADRLVALDETRRAAIAEAERLRSARNARSKEIGALKAQQRHEEAQRLIEEMAGAD